MPVRFFYGYSHVDTKVKGILDTHLRPLSELNIVHWDDCEIRSGEEWASKIKKQLNAADIILLLISADFLRSKYCCEEMKMALARHERGEARVIPIILRPVRWDNTPLSKLQVLPRNGDAITLWHNKDQACVDVKKEIDKAVDEVQSRRESQGDTLFEQKCFSEALASYIDALDKTPDNPVLYKKKGDTLFSLARWTEAIAAYEKVINNISAIEETSTIVQVYTNMGEALFIIEKHKEALEAFTAAIEKDSDNAELRRYEGDTYRELGLLDQAQCSYEQAITLEPDNPYFHKEYGDILLQLERFPEARAQFDEAIRLKPKFGNAYYGRSQILNALAQVAYEEYKRLTQLAQEDEEQFKRLKTRQDC